MTFKRIMGFVYLIFFLGFMGYKLNYHVQEQENPILIILLFIVIFLMLLMAIRKIIVDS